MFFTHGKWSTIIKTQPMKEMTWKSLYNAVACMQHYLASTLVHFLLQAHFVPANNHWSEVLLTTVFEVVWSFWWYNCGDCKDSWMCRTKVMKYVWFSSDSTLRIYCYCEFTVTLSYLSVSELSLFSHTHLHCLYYSPKTFFFLLLHACSSVLSYLVLV